MLILRPSSPLPLIETERDEVERPSGAAVSADEGPPIPDSYDTDAVRAVMQDPFRILVYWEVTEATLHRLTRYFSPDDVASFGVVLKLVAVDEPDEAFFDVGRNGRYWMMVMPGREYEFEIGVRSPVHGYIPLVRSNRVRTPRGAVSAEPADESEYRMTPPVFLQVIEASGFAPSRTMNVATAGTALEREELLQSVLAKLAEPVRAALAIAAAGGALARADLERLDWPLRGELLKVFEIAGGPMASLVLMNYLPELVREIMEGGASAGAVIHPSYLAPRFFVGGSESVIRSASKMGWPAIASLPFSAEPLRRG